ncbi:MFS transporter [Novosphingobium sp. FSY-8]|uniref:MFS transporter n=2 Tax=Novosphingobium ovatum TaxID=1908523 RepID=A0ABW9X980_9SPHN|nr:MFS transporter [Novosphingobium ovatum]
MITSLRWWMIGLVTLGTILNYLARSTLSVAAPTLKAELHITTQQYSWVVMAFQASYTVMQSVSGAVLDALGTRVGFMIFAVGWALANALHAFAGGWAGLAFFRGLLGASEAAAIPAGAKVVAEWFPAKERSLATSGFQMGTSIGNMIAPPLVTFCILLWGWRSAFVVTGAISLLWAMLWWVAYRRPQDHPALSPQERDLIAQDEPLVDATQPAPSRMALLRERAFWAIAVPRFLAEPAWQTFNFFIPLYLVTVWKLDLKTVAIWAWLPFLAADLGSLAAGMLPNALMRRGVGLVPSRKVTMAVGALLMAGPACMGLAHSAQMAIALFCVGGFAHQMLSGALITLCSDVFPRQTVGTATGMIGSAGWIGGILFTFIIGQSADSFGYGPLFAAFGVLDLLGCVVLWKMLRG